MSWSDIFPVMVDDMIGTYHQQASAQEKETLRQYFALASIHHQKPAHHVVATSLFWKPAHEGGQDYPEPTRELMKNPQNEGLDSRFKNPWEYYVEPIFRTARQLAEKRPDLTYRVYLANDLAFLIPELGEAGCEVYLMESSSILHNPGAMWRFLAMEEEGLVTMNDSDRAKWLIHDVERTEGLAEGPLSCWRCPYMWETVECKDLGSPGGYHPYSAAMMGSTKPLPIRLLAEAFIWSCQKGIIRGECQIGERTAPILGSRWPEYGFDEFFLAAAFHPRAAFEGIMSFVNWKNHKLNQWFALDIEYTTWANPASEIMFWGDPSEVSADEKRKAALPKPNEKPA